MNAGNRPGNYLTPNAFDEVTRQFKMRTGLDYTHTQLKNKWDKLKCEFSIFKKLKFWETGAGWDYVKNTVSQDDEWWKKAKIVVASSRRKDLLMNKTCELCLEISQLRALTIGIPLRACLLPLVRQ